MEMVQTMMNFCTLPTARHAPVLTERNPDSKKPHHCTDSVKPGGVRMSVATNSSQRIPHPGRGIQDAMDAMGEERGALVPRKGRRAVGVLSRSVG